MFRMRRAARCTKRKYAVRFVVLSATLLGGVGYYGLFGQGSGIGLGEVEGDAGIHNVHGGERSLQGQMYPTELFSTKQQKAGALVLHSIGVLYMFVALALVCDECFVPALEVLVERYDIDDDVAGATFMAAGGSAPELFTSLIGVFIAKSNVGFGTIIGSAVFNVLFVIGMCAMFSSVILELTWWPLARDCSFYTFDLVMLYIFFMDKEIAWWEAGLLICFYFMYVGFMFINAKAEVFVKKMLGVKVTPDEEAAEGGKADEEMKSPPAEGAPGWTDDSEPTKVSGRHSEPAKSAGSNARSSISTGTTYNQVRRSVYASTLQVMLRDVDPKGKGPNKETDARFKRAVTMNSPSGKLEGEEEPKAEPEKEKEKEEEEEEEEGFDLSWPDNTWSQVNYVLTAPLLYTLAYSVPNVRKEEKKHLWPLSFLFSILWIGFFTYWMIWWAQTIGEAVGIPDEVMGYTVLAAGTSVPDLITSVLVAQEGLGDMAVSSSIGSNIFDITFGLPIPWFFWTLGYGRNIEVDSESLTFSLVLLIIMLVAIVVIIAASGWKMTKALGGMMFGLYAIFLMLVLLKNYKKLGPLNDF